MESLSFADKVNNAFGDGWKSNPQFSKALKEIEQVVEDNRIAKELSTTISIENFFKESSEPKIDTIEDDER